MGHMHRVIKKTFVKKMRSCKGGHKKAKISKDCWLGIKTHIL